MEQINIKMLSDDALNFMKKNIESVTLKIQTEDNNDWIYSTFPQPMFVTKNIRIDDFVLKRNPDSKDKTIDFINSVALFNSLNKLPRYILTDERFWLWLHFEKCYIFVKEFMFVKSSTTIKDHWMHKQGKRRSLFFGVLSRMYFRVELAEENGDFSLAQWVIENPNRFRNLSWRTYSSAKHIVLGVLKGEKKAFDETGIERTDIYESISKYISNLGSVRLLDAIEINVLEKLVYEKIIAIQKTIR